MNKPIWWENFIVLILTLRAIVAGLTVEAILAIPLFFVEDGHNPMGAFDPILFGFSVFFAPLVAFVVGAWLMPHFTAPDDPPPKGRKPLPVGSGFVNNCGAASPARGSGYARGLWLRSGECV